MELIQGDTVEKYLFADNRDAFLKSLVPGSQEYFHLNLLHHLNNEPIKEFPSNLLQSYENNFSNESKAIQLRFILKSFDNAIDLKSKKSLLKQINNLVFHFDFRSNEIGISNEANEIKNINKDQAKKIGKKFSLKNLCIDDKLKKAVKSEKNMMQLTERGLSHIPVSDIISSQEKTIKYFLSNSPLSHYEPEEIVRLLEASQLLKDFTKKKEKGLLISICRRLDLKQMGFLIKNIASLELVPAFVEEIFAKTFSYEIRKVSSREITVQERHQLFSLMLDWANNQSFKTHILTVNLSYMTLATSIFLGKYDFSLFEKFLCSPLYKSRDFVEGINDSCLKLGDGYDYLLSVEKLLPREVDQSVLIEIYLEKHFDLNGNLSRWRKYFKKAYLDAMESYQTILSGRVTDEVLKSLEKSQLEKASKEKKLTLSRENKTQFAADDKISLTVNIKNITSLTVRVFEIECERYYKQKIDQISEFIDLEGFIPTEQKVFDFSNESPFKKISQVFNFKSIEEKTRGIFIIDFIGGGLQTRALIRKGTLTALRFPSLEGNTFTMVDEINQICFPTDENSRIGIFVKETFFSADQSGCITIPFVQNHEQSEPAILIYNDFAVLLKDNPLILKPEKYEFSCEYLYNNESFILGNSADILIKPFLTLNGEKVNLSILKDLVVSVTTLTQTNIPSTQSYPATSFSNFGNPEFSGFNLKFLVPAKLKKISVEVRGFIEKKGIPESSSKEKRIDIADNHQIQNFESFVGNAFSTLFLRKVNNHYHVLLLGKNAEPKPNVQLQLVFNHAYWKKPLSFHSVTDNDGTVDLGDLELIREVKVEVLKNQEIEAKGLSFSPHNFFHMIPNEIRVIKGEGLKFPYKSKHKEFWLRKKGPFYSEVVEDLTSFVSLSNEELLLPPLDIGIYELEIYDQPSCDKKEIIKIQVLEGAYLKGTDYIITKDNIITRRGCERFYMTIGLENNMEDQPILRLDQNFKEWKLHLISYNFVPQNLSKIFEIFEKHGDRLEALENFKTVNKTVSESVILGKSSKIQEEVQYVIERANLCQYMGSTLAKPQLILKKQFVRAAESLQHFSKKFKVLKRSPTKSPRRLRSRSRSKSSSGSISSALASEKSSSSSTNTEKNDNSRSKWKGHSIRGRGGKSRCYRIRDRERERSISSGYMEKGRARLDKCLIQEVRHHHHNGNADFYQNLAATIQTLFTEFLSEPGCLVSEVETDPYGCIELSSLCDKGHSLVIAVGTNIVSGAMFMQSFELPRILKLKTRDLTHKNNTKSERYFSISREIFLLKGGEQHYIADSTGWEIQIIDSLQKLFEVQVELKRCLGESFKKDNWSFFCKWDTLELDEKQKLYDEFASHELNIFLFFKDRVFFDMFVKGFIANRLKKSFVDYFLLGDLNEILEYTNISKIQELNCFELILLIIALGSEQLKERLDILSIRKEITLYIETKNKLIRRNNNSYKMLFDTVLYSKFVKDPQLNQMKNPEPAKPERTSKEAMNVEHPKELAPPPQNIFPITQQFGFQPQSTAVMPNLFGSSNPRNVSNIMNPLSQNLLMNALQPKVTLGTGGQQSLFGAGGQQGLFGAGGQQGLFGAGGQQGSIGAGWPGQQGLFGAGWPGQQGLSGPGGQPEPFGASVQQASIDNNGQLMFFSNAGPENLNMKFQEMNDMDKNIRNVFEEWEPIGVTKEYCDRGYHDICYNDDTVDLMEYSNFWVDAARYFYESNESGMGEKPCLSEFLSGNFLFANKNPTEMMAVLSLLSLPFSSSQHSFKSLEAKGLLINAGSNMIIFSKNFKESKAELQSDIIIIQKFFDKKDRYVYSDEDPNIKLDKQLGEYLINKVYGCEVVVTNTSVNSHEFQVLTEIPCGSIPINGNDYTKSHTLLLEPYSTKTISYFFYFPEEGVFPVNPANVSKNSVVVAIARAAEFNVKRERSQVRSDTIQEVIATGNKEEILKFAETKNILNKNIFDFEKLGNFFLDEDFFLKFTNILRKRCIYNNKTWAYSLIHGDTRTLMEFFNHKQNKKTLSSYLKNISTSLITIKSFTFLEYFPLITPRAHFLRGETSRFFNKDVQEQYRSLVCYLAEAETINLEEKLMLIYYLLIQERIEESIKLFKTLDEAEIMKSGICLLQYDYLRAYLDFYLGYPNFLLARDICEKYLDYPVISWRALFHEMANQISEFLGDDIMETEGNKAIVLQETDEILRDKRADKEEIVEASINDSEIIIDHKNAKRLVISYYEIDIEIIFSKNPFFKEFISKDLGFIKPNLRKEILVEKPELLTKTLINLTEEFGDKNSYIRIEGESKTVSLTNFKSRLKVHIITKFGLVKVTDDKNKPLSKIYVKAFVKDKKNYVRFFKDGYTDLRGKFEYATTHSKEISQIEKFGLLIKSEDYGSIVKEAEPPKAKSKQTVMSALCYTEWNQKWRNQHDLNFQSYQQNKLLKKK